MRHTHRRGGVAVLAVGLALVVAVGSAVGRESQSGPIKIGLVSSLSGPAGLYGRPVADSAQLAIEEINAKGGVLGRKLALEVEDDASVPATGRLVAQRLITKDRVDALIAMTNSAVREAFTPVVKRDGLPFVYVTLYEGGACLKNMFSIGEVPPQYNPVYRHVVGSIGKKSWYLIGHDYVWPQKVLPAARQAVRKAGGTVVGQDLVPFGTTDFAQIIDKIQASDADTVLVALVGADFGSFLKQWRSFGLNRSTIMVTLTMTDDFMQALGADAKGVYSIFGYFEDLKTTTNRRFVSKYHKRFPKAFAQNTLSEGTYDAVYAYARAVANAGTTDSAKVNAALAGVTFPSAPRGALTIQRSTHHVNQTMYLVRANGKGNYVLAKKFPNISPGPQCRF